MKKVMLSAAVCALAFSANADVASEVVVADAIQASAFNSIYAGLGIGGSFLKGDDYPYVEAVDDVGPDEGVKLGYMNPKANRFIGSFVLGGGKVFNNKIYVGAEFLMDFTKNKKFSVENVYVKTSLPAGYAEADIYGKVGGFMPQVNAKLGYAFNKCTLAYAKLGCAWTKVTVDSYEAGTDDKIDNASFSKTKAAFVLGVGAEKAFCKKFSAAVEGDYNFGWKYSGLKFNKGWTVRALVKYNVKY